MKGQKKGEVTRIVLTIIFEIHKSFMTDAKDIGVN